MIYRCCCYFVWFLVMSNRYFAVIVLLAEDPDWQIMCIDASQSESSLAAVMCIPYIVASQSGSSH